MFQVHRQHHLRHLGPFGGLVGDDSFRLQESGYPVFLAGLSCYGVPDLGFETVNSRGVAGVCSLDIGFGEQNLESTATDLGDHSQAELRLGRSDHSLAWSKGRSKHSRRFSRVGKDPALKKLNRHDMKLDAMLCDFATVREGLLHILGGGINRLWREEYPAPLGVTLGLLFEVHPTEMDSEHTLEVVMIDADGKEIGNVSADFAIAPDPDNGRPGETLILPLVVPLQQVVLPAPGAYSVEVLIDGQHKRSLGVLAAPPFGENDRRSRGRTGGGLN